MEQYQPSKDEWKIVSRTIAAAEFGGSILGGSLLLVQILMVLYGVQCFLRMPKDRQQGRRRFIAFSCLLLATSTVDVIFDLWDSFIILFDGRLSNDIYFEAFTYPKPCYKPYTRVWGGQQGYAIIGDVMLVSTIVLGDILLLWRCLVLWRRSKWVIALPLFAGIGSLVCHIVYFAIGGPDRAADAVIAAVVLSVTMNVMVTALIVFEVGMAWWVASRSLPSQGLCRVYSGIIEVMIESAAPLAFFGICWITVRAIWVSQPPEAIFLRGRLYVLDGIFNWLYSSFCALSPQMIIVRLTTGTLWRDGSESTCGSGTAFSEPIHFACNTSFSGEQSLVSTSKDSNSA